MPSRGSAGMSTRGPERDWRTVIEHALHGLAIALLLVLIWQAIRLLNDRPTAIARGGDVRAALARWSTVESPKRAHVALDSSPPPEVRGWIATLRSTSTHTPWEGGALVPSAVSAEAVADPKHPTRIWVAASNQSRVVVGGGCRLRHGPVAA